MPEARYFPRSKVRFPVTLSLNEEHERAFVVDLSEGGMYAEVNRTYPSGAEIVASVHIPGRPNPIRARGSIVRSDKAKPDSAAGIAISWIDLDDAQARILCDVVEEREPMVWDDTPNNVVPREIAIQFIPIIRRIGKRFAARLPPHVSVEDLLGAGFVALIEIYRKHQDLPMEELERVAMKRLRGAMLDELRAVDPLSRRTRVRERKIAETRRDLESKLGRSVSHDEVRARMKLNTQMYEHRGARFF
jgi:Tfp pilus assembly protein PilZ